MQLVYASTIIPLHIYSKEIKNYVHTKYFMQICITTLQILTEKHGNKKKILPWKNALN